MKKKLIGLTVLAVMVVLACAGCAGTPSAGGLDANGQRSAEPEVSAAVDGDAPDTSDPASTDSAIPVTLTIDGEDYVFPMPYEEFAAKGWIFYDPEFPPLEDQKEGLNPGYHGGSLFFSKGDVKALEVIFYNPTDSFQSFAECEVAGIQVNYDQQIDGKEAELVMSIPAGSIQVNGQGIGEADRDDIVAAFGEDAAFVTSIPADSIQVVGQKSSESNCGDVVAVLGKDWDLGYDAAADLNDFDTFLWWLDRNERNEGNDDTLTLSFDETGVFTEMTFLKTK